MSDQVLSLKWNNHQMSFTSKVAYLHNKEKFTDVTIACDEKFYPAHKLILSTCSEYFDKMFSRVDCKHPIIVLKDISQKNIEMLLNYMYLGEVNVDQADLPSLMKAAECLRIKGLAVTDIEEHPKKRKHSLETSSSKRRNIESSSKSSKHNLAEETSPYTHPLVASGSGNKILKKAASPPPPPIENKDFQDILFPPIKEEKVDMTEEKYYEDVEESDLGGNYSDENIIHPGSQHEQEYQDYPAEEFDPQAAPDDNAADFSTTQQDYSTVSRRLHCCSFCAYKTIQKSALRKHTLVHTGERPFSCQFCPYKTRQKSNLKTHVSCKH